MLKCVRLDFGVHDPLCPWHHSDPKGSEYRGACWRHICSVSEVQAQRSCHHKAAQLEAIGGTTYIYLYRTICMLSSACLSGLTSTNCTTLCSCAYPLSSLFVLGLIKSAKLCELPRAHSWKDAAEKLSCSNLWKPDFDSLHDFPLCICLWWMFYACKQEMLIREIVWNVSPLCMLIIITEDYAVTMQQW